MEAQSRIEIPREYAHLAKNPEPLLDDLSKLAACSCNCPIGQITLLSDTTSYFVAEYGARSKPRPVAGSFYAEVLAAPNHFLVRTLPKSEWNGFSEEQRATRYRFSAGVAITLPFGQAIGVLSVSGHSAIDFPLGKIATLQCMAKQVAHVFNARFDRRRAQGQKAALSEERMRLQNVLEASRMGAWELDVAKDVLHCSGQFEEIMGVPEGCLETIALDCFRERVHQEDLPSLLKKVEGALTPAKDRYTVKYRLLKENGDWLWIQERGKVMEWTATGTPKKMYGTLLDCTETTKHQLERRRARNNLYSLINGTGDLLWSVDAEFRLITANTAFLEIVKGNSGTCIVEGDSVLLDVYPDEVVTTWKSYYQRALNGEEFSVKRPLSDKNKPWLVYGRVSFSPIRNDAFEVVGVACCSRDITAESLSRQIILNSQQELQKVLDTSLDIICTIDVQGRFILVNRSCERIWGYHPREIIGRHFSEFVSPKAVVAAQAAAGRLIRGAYINNLENEVICKNGDTKAMLWSANWNPGDRRMYCIARDISEKKAAEKKLKISEQRFKSLVQDGSELIAILDKDANYIYASPTSESVLGFAPHEFEGSNAFAFIHEADHDMVMAALAKIHECDQLQLEPFRFKHKDGNWRWISTKATNLLQHPAIQGIVTNSNDVTERVNHLRAIEEQNRRLKEIAWTQSHVVRAPVARLMGLVDLMREKRLTAREREQVLGYLLNSAKDIDAVIRDIVEHTKIAVEEEK